MVFGIDNHKCGGRRGQISVIGTSTSNVFHNYLFIISLFYLDTKYSQKLNYDKIVLLPYWGEGGQIYSAAVSSDSDSDSTETSRHD